MTITRRRETYANIKAKYIMHIRKPSLKFMVLRFKKYISNYVDDRKG